MISEVHENGYIYSAREKMNTFNYQENNPASLLRFPFGESNE